MFRFVFVALVSLVTVVAVGCGSENADKASVDEEPLKMTAEPSEVEPGGELQISYSEPKARGVLLRLLRLEDDNWVDAYDAITTEAPGQRGDPVTVGVGELDVADIGASPEEPDEIIVSESAPSGTYRACIPLDVQGWCAEFEVTD